MKRGISIMLSALICALSTVGVTAASGEEEIVHPHNILCSIVGHKDRQYTAGTDIAAGPNNDYCSYTYDLIIIDCERCGEVIYEYEAITSATPHPGTEPFYFNGKYLGEQCTDCGMPIVPLLS